MLQAREKKMADPWKPYSPSEADANQGEYSPSNPEYSFYGTAKPFESPPYVPTSPAYVATSPAYAPLPLPPQEQVAHVLEWHCDVVHWLAVFNAFFAHVKKAQPPVVKDMICLDLVFLPLMPRDFVSQALISAVDRVVTSAKKELPPSAPIATMKVEFDAEVGFLVRKPTAGLSVPFRAQLSNGNLVLLMASTQDLSKWDFWRSARCYTRQIRTCLSASPLRALDMPTLTRAALEKDTNTMWPPLPSVISGAGVGPCEHKLVCMSVDQDSWRQSISGLRDRLKTRPLEKILSDFSLVPPGEFMQTNLILHLAGADKDFLKPWLPIDMESLERFELQQVKASFEAPNAKKRPQPHLKNRKLQKRPNNAHK